MEMTVSFQGLSPHIRGNLSEPSLIPIVQGSIPAHTGEPLGREPRSGPCGVYPRTYGGTMSLKVKVSSSMGLSPHIRGNRKARRNILLIQGSIPAHTGEPNHSHIMLITLKVYPRTYGGTMSCMQNISSIMGLSPHIRGNPGLCIGTFIGTGSIPAHTGEPSNDYPADGRSGVYPRTYGGTISSSVHWANRRGLSPHIRGNPLSPLAVFSSIGSIPAHTGEPVEAHCDCRNNWVYPRTYGGTPAVRQWTLPCAGLSPHIRGNRRTKPRVSVLRGSIPAHTGEPGTGVPGIACRGVYPRTYGGTIGLMNTGPGHWGLSPHIRGNQIEGQTFRISGGSIPAHTGEPV